MFNNYIIHVKKTNNKVITDLYLNYSVLKIIPNLSSYL